MLSTSEKVNYLVEREFDIIKAALNKNCRIESFGLKEEERQDYITQAALYHAELSQKPIGDVDDLFKAEKKRDREEQLALMRRQREEEEKQQFFNKDFAKANYVFWAKAAYWELDEAVALCRGRDPKVVTWDKIKDFRHHSPFVMVYADIRELATRARKAGELHFPIKPDKFLIWCKHKHIKYPEELDELVIKYGGTIEDCRKENIELSGTIAQLKTENAQLNKQLAERDSTQAEHCKNDKGLGSRERETFLKILIAVAIQHYGFKPGDTRNRTAQDMCDATERAGVRVDVKTIRPKLREAAELLPQNIDI